MIVKNNERVVVPKLLDVMYVTHCREESTQWLARKSYFWKKMKDVSVKIAKLSNYPKPNSQSYKETKPASHGK